MSSNKSLSKERPRLSRIEYSLPKDSTQIPEELFVYIVLSRSDDKEKAKEVLNDIQLFKQNQFNIKYYIDTDGGVRWLPVSKEPMGFRSSRD